MSWLLIHTPPPQRVPPLTDAMRLPSMLAYAFVYGTHFQVVEAPIGFITSSRKTSGIGFLNNRSNESAKRLMRTSLYS